MSRDWRTLTRVAVKGAVRWVLLANCIGWKLDPR